MKGCSGVNVRTMNLLCLFLSTYLAGRGLLSQIPAPEEDFAVDLSPVFESTVNISFTLALLSACCKKQKPLPESSQHRLHILNTFLHR